MVVKLFKTLVHPILEYGNSIEGLNFILDQRKIVSIQSRATRLIPSIRTNSYSERLDILDLPYIYMYTYIYVYIYVCVCVHAYIYNLCQHSTYKVLVSWHTSSDLVTTEI